MIKDPLEIVCACLMAFHKIAQEATSSEQANDLFATTLTALCGLTKKKPKDLIKILDKIRNDFYKDTMQ
jgi:hypothetical protein